MLVVTVKVIEGVFTEKQKHDLAAKITDVIVAFEGSEAFREVVWVLIEELGRDSWHAYHGGASSVASFSARHDITGASVWTTALVLMAFGQVLARLGVLQGRRIRAISQPAASRQVPSNQRERDASRRPRL